LRYSLDIETVATRRNSFGFSEAICLSLADAFCQRTRWITQMYPFESKNRTELNDRQFSILLNVETGMSVSV